MNRLPAALLVLALGACTLPLGGNQGSSSRAAGNAPAGGQDDRRLAACRAEATRLVQYRDRGQLMRSDEAASQVGTGASSFGTPYTRNRIETEQLGAQVERDRLVAECMRGTPGQGGTR